MSVATRNAVILFRQGAGGQQGQRTATGEFMAIQCTCTGCGRQLGVDLQYAGMQARCPMCNTIVRVPAADAAQADVQPADASWRMKTPEGYVYGPVAKPQVDAWVAEGRVSGDCKLQHGESAPWMDAHRVYPELTEDPAPVAASLVAASPANRPARHRARQRLAPHRGPLILALGILSWLACPVFGVFAWMLGNRDLQDMQAGKMDPEGTSLTQAGQILGMVHVMLCLLALVGGMFLLLLGFVAS
jgi:hypothetical protein